MQAGERSRAADEGASVQLTDRTGGGHAGDPPHPRGLDALELRKPQVVELAAVPDQPSGRVADHDLAGGGQTLEAGREVDRLAEGRGVDAPGVAHLADHRHAGRHAHPRREAHTVRRGEGVVHVDDALQHRRPGAHRALRSILERPRIAEDHQQAVTEVLGDVPTELGRRRRADLLVGEDQFRQVLGVELLRQGGRTDEVAEEDRDLSSLAG